ncbi:netrin receptor DSCAM-like protein [Dinothrombium tinctorium]|uniref:Netrin receptor DSCAM-like protein n=1 Tax=Dinothrombium tinctorium TaxID=1965070 RepID=A0A443RJT0_9ACAR|nr:netrin receptor DSCAM-like protein [Dinothrombium tinctorium]
MTPIYFLFTVLALQVDAISPTVYERGPRFVIEPPVKVEFSNNSGAVINCNAVGVPSPKITWTRKEGLHPIHDLNTLQTTNSNSLRHIRSDGSLLFNPFSMENYRPDIHSATYRCIVSNAVGTIVSRDVNVKAVRFGAFNVDALLALLSDITLKRV